MSFYSPPQSTTVKPAMRVDVYSHHITISQFDDYVKHLLLQYCKGLGHYGLKMVAPRQFVRAITSVYAARTVDNREFRFHIQHKEDVLRSISSRGLMSTSFDVVEHPFKDPVHVEFPDAADVELRDYQIPMVEYLVSEGITKILPVQTGKGKGIMSMKAIERIGWRTGIAIKGMYVEKWVIELKEILGLKTKDIMVVRGSSDLRAVMDIALAGALEAKFIIITGKTLYNYYKAYEANPNMDTFEYPVHPDNLWEALGCGIRLIDEVHQEFHANFRIDLYTHVRKTISMSATLDADDQFINRMYMVMFPADSRPHTIEYDKYIDVMALEYRLTDFKRVKYMGVNKMYSQVRFEQSLMRYKDLLAKYLRMIMEITDDQFVQIFDPGQKILIFCATTEMCTILRDYLQQRWPDVAVGRYVQEDDFVTLETNDIIVSTLKSAGTAVDIPGLRVTFMTDSVDSKQANIQAVGRLRRLKQWPEVTPMFIYMFAGNLDKHRVYHERKQFKLKGKVLSYRCLLTNYHI